MVDMRNDRGVTDQVDRLCRQQVAGRVEQSNRMDREVAGLTGMVVADQQCGRSTIV